MRNWRVGRKEFEVVRSASGTRRVSCNFGGLNMRKILAVALALAVMDASAQDVQTVKIGHVAPISGPQASYGKDNENGARMAIEDLNAQNVVIGGKKIKFELVAEDDAADP